MGGQWPRTGRATDDDVTNQPQLRDVEHWVVSRGHTY
jgi:hypothetical protein